MVTAMPDAPQSLLPDFTPWDKADTRAYLDANPLPPDFLWLDDEKKSRAVLPRHASVTGYGKWLAETPYFPGLFELIHRVLVNAPDLGDATWLAAELNRRRPAAQPEIF